MLRPFKEDIKKQREENKKRNDELENMKVREFSWKCFRLCYRRFYPLLTGPNKNEKKEK